MTICDVRRLVPKDWTVRVVRPSDGGSAWVAIAAGPADGRYGTTGDWLSGRRRMPIAYFGADTRSAAIAGLIRRLQSDQRPDDEAIG